MQKWSALWLFFAFSLYGAAKPIYEAKLGYFSFAEETLCSLYDRGGADVQLSLSLPLFRALYAYGAVEWFERSYKGEVFSSRIVALPLSIGAGLSQRLFPHVQGYFIGGARYFILKVQNTPKEANERSGSMGTFLGTGMQLYLRKFLIDFFGEYSYCKAPLPIGPLLTNMNVGGTTLGGAVGVSF